MNLAVNPRLICSLYLMFCCILFMYLLKFGLFALVMDSQFQGRGNLLMKQPSYFGGQNGLKFAIAAFMWMMPKPEPRSTSRNRE